METKHQAKDKSKLSGKALAEEMRKNYKDPGIIKLEDVGRLGLRKKIKEEQAKAKEKKPDAEAG